MDGCSGAQEPGRAADVAHVCPRLEVCFRGIALESLLMIRKPLGQAFLAGDVYMSTPHAANSWLY